MSISLTSPAALMLLWTLLVVYALHHRRRARRQVTLPSLHLLPDTTVTGAAAGGTPKDRTLLLVRLLICLLTVAALAGPMGDGAPVSRLVLVVDTSASMGAPAPGRPGRTRLEAAVAKAQAAVDELSPRHALVLAAGASPRAVGGWTDADGVGAILGRLGPEGGGAEMGLAVAEAEALAGPEGLVRVFDDEGAPIPGNRSIVSLTFRPYTHVVERGAFLVRLRRGPRKGTHPDGEVFVAIDAGGRRVATLRIVVKAGEEASGWAEYRGPGGVPARATLLGSDPLAVDDQAAVPIPRLTRRRIALVTAGNEEVERALRAWPRADVQTRPLGRHPPADLLILDGAGTAGPDRAAVMLRPPGPSHLATPVGAPPDRPGLAAGIARGRLEVTALPDVPAGGRALLQDAAGDPLLWVRTSPGPARAALAFDPGRQGLADDPMHAVFWADVLAELLLPEDGGCRRVPVGARVGAGQALTRVGLYDLPSGCFIASTPHTESHPPKRSDAAVASERRPAHRPLGGPLAALAFALLVLEWALARRTRRGPDARRGPKVLRGAALLALAVAFRPPSWGGAATGRQAFIVDGSPSVGRAGRLAAAKQVEEWAREGDDRWVFGGVVRRSADADWAARAEEGLPGGSNLGRALWEAGRSVGPGGSVVALTDGRSTAGPPPVEVAGRLRRRGVTVHTTAAWGDASDVWVEGVGAPPRLRVGDRSLVTAVIRRVGQGARGDITFSLDGRDVGVVEADLTDRSAAVVSLRVAFEHAGRRELRVRLTGGFSGDASEANDVAGALVDVAGPAKTLWVRPLANQEPSGGGLTPVGRQISVIEPRQVPASQSKLARYDLIVLDDVALADLPPGADAALSHYVRSGGGLVAGGGRRSFGPGGYPGSPLDDVLPLKSDPRKAGGRLAAVLLLDKSGSMGGDAGGWERLLLAKATLRTLLASFRRPDDRVGVLGYDTGAIEILPMTAVVDVRPGVVDTGSLNPAGGTDPVPALRLAQKWLGAAERYPTRHVVVVSDGRLPGVGTEAAVAALREAGITTSTVGVGTAADTPRLRAVAAAGGGDHLAVTELVDLPGVIARQLLSAVQEPVHEGIVDVTSGPDLRGIFAGPSGRWPALGGLVRTGLHPEAHLWLAATSGEPLLAGRRAGAGRTAAFASQLQGPWSAAWATDSAARRVVSSAFAWATRRRRGGWEATVREVDGASVRVVLDAVDGAGRPVSDLEPVAVVDGGGGGRKRGAMTAVAPGRYALTVAAAGSGVIAASMLQDADVVGRASMLRLSDPELRARGDDAAALAAIAAAGGGAVVLRGAALPPPEGGEGGRPVGRGALLLAALLLFLTYLKEEGRPASAP